MSQSLYIGPGSSATNSGSTIVDAVVGRARGKRAVTKDNVAVAGMPTANGSSLLNGFRAASKALVVGRILAAGGEIVGKAISKNLGFSSGSHTIVQRLHCAIGYR